MFKPAGALGLLAAQADRAGAVGPFDAAFRRFEPRPAPWRRDGDQAGRALDHHVADIGGGRGDQAAELHGAGLDAALDPAGAGARLARPASGHVRPDPPVARGRAAGSVRLGDARGSRRVAGRTRTIRRTNPRASGRPPRARPAARRPVALSRGNPGFQSAHGVVPRSRRRDLPDPRTWRRPSCRKRRIASAASLTDSELASLGELDDPIGRPGARWPTGRWPDRGRGGDTTRSWPELWAPWPIGRPSGWARRFCVPTLRWTCLALSQGLAGIYGFCEVLCRLALVGSQWHYSTDSPFRPAHGSQPGAQAGRHALEGQGQLMGTGCWLAGQRDKSVRSQHRGNPGSDAQREAHGRQARRSPHRTDGTRAVDANP